MKQYEFSQRSRKFELTGSLSILVARFRANWSLILWTSLGRNEGNSLTVTPRRLGFFHCMCNGAEPQLAAIVRESIFANGSAGKCSSSSPYPNPNGGLFYFHVKITNYSPKLLFLCLFKLHSTLKFNNFLPFIYIFFII